MGRDDAATRIQATFRGNEGRKEAAVKFAAAFPEPPFRTGKTEPAAPGTGPPLRGPEPGRGLVRGRPASRQLLRGKGGMGMGTEGGNVPPRRERPTLSRLPDGKAPASGPPAGAALRDLKRLHSPAGHAETAPFDDEEVISKFIKMYQNVID